MTREEPRERSELIDMTGRNGRNCTSTVEERTGRRSCLARLYTLGGEEAVKQTLYTCVYLYLKKFLKTTTS